MSQTQPSIADLSASPGPNGGEVEPSAPENLSPEQEALAEAQAAAGSDETDDPGDSFTGLTEGLAPIPLSPDLAELIAERLRLLVQVELLEKAREHMREGDLSDTASRELTRQSRELVRIPDAEIARGMRERLERKLTGAGPDEEPTDAVDAGAADESCDEEPLDSDGEQIEAEAGRDRTDTDIDDDLDSDEDLEALDGDRDDDLDDEFDVDEEGDDDGEPDAASVEETVKTPSEAGDEAADQPAASVDASVADPALSSALQLGVRQAALFEQRDATTSDLLAVAQSLTACEPLREVLIRGGCESDTLYGWTVYMLALERYRADAVAKMEASASELAGLQEDRASRKQPEKLKQAEEADDAAKRLVAAIRREMKAVEPLLVDAFWQVYEEAAVLMGSPALTQDDRLHLRGLLRYGILTQTPYIIPLRTQSRLMENCLHARDEWDDSTTATHILYADEYIDLTAKGMLTPSLDEDLELNGKGTELWRADKMWRKHIHSRVHESALKETRVRLVSRIDAISRKNQELQERIDNLDRSDRKYKEKRAKRIEKIKSNRVVAARHERAVDVIDNQRMPALLEARHDNESKLKGVVESMTPEVIARREARAMRRMARLCAKLKEPFLPFVMREFYREETGVVNDRPTMESEIAQIEQCDPNVFREILTHSKKPENRNYLRFCPYIVMIPCRGMMSLSWNPRGGPEVGRIAVPFLSMRPGGLSEMLHTVMADFRYDTSRESAGVDLLTSDTLVAAYATVRWNYRKRNRETREKAGIFNEEKDRINWRRHYKLFITSAMDGGKRLFFKCPEVYETVVKYVGLPRGVEKLRAA